MPGASSHDEDWNGTADVVSRRYNPVLADCGSGLFQPASRAVLSTVASLVIVASASVDGAKQAAVAMEWLRQRGYQQLFIQSCVVVNHVGPGKAHVDVENLVNQFERFIPQGRVVVPPYDRHVPSVEEIQFEPSSPAFRRRIIELAAALSDDYGRD